MELSHKVMRNTSDTIEAGKKQFMEQAGVLLNKTKEKYMRLAVTSWVHEVDDGARIEVAP